MNDKSSVEVHEEMSDRSFFVIGLEKDTTPINLVELHESLRRWDINQRSMKEY